jgi:hypothetical protein
MLICLQAGQILAAVLLQNVAVQRRDSGKPGSHAHGASARFDNRRAGEIDRG